MPVHARSCRNPEGDDERDTPPDPEKSGVKRAMYRLNTSRPKVVQVRDYSEKQVQKLRNAIDIKKVPLPLLHFFEEFSQIRIGVLCFSEGHVTGLSQTTVVKTRVNSKERRE